MIELLENIYAVKLPEGATDIFINNVGCLRYSHDNGRQSSCIEPEQMKMYLEKDKHRILFLTRDATDSDWEKVVDELFLGDKPYAWENYGFGLPKYKTATASGHSLLRSKGLNPDKNYCLIEKSEK